MKHEQSVATAVENYVSEATKAADSYMKNAGRESASTLDPGPDHQRLAEGGA